jgi:hypothetical protein
MTHSRLATIATLVLGTAALAEGLLLVLWEPLTWALGGPLPCGSLIDALTGSRWPGVLLGIAAMAIGLWLLNRGWKALRGTTWPRRLVAVGLVLLASGPIVALIELACFMAWFQRYF